MNKQEVKNEVQRHYDRLIELGYNVVGVFLYGSQNYELDHDGSDVDTKAIVLPSLNDIVLNKQPISTTIDMGDNWLCDVKDIRKMFECFKKQNINFIELLFTNHYVLNKEYSILFQPMLDNAETIARYNKFGSLNCMYGMSMEKNKAMTHPYPSIKEKIDKYGWDNKQLHHILRMRDFIERYTNEETYRTILIPKNKEKLLKVKTEYNMSLEEAKELAKNTCNEIKKIRDDYFNSHESILNEGAIDIINKVSFDIIKHSIRKEVL